MTLALAQSDPIRPAGGIAWSDPDWGHRRQASNVEPLLVRQSEIVVFY